MAESFDFTEEEIRRKLEQLGYSNIPSDKLKLFQRGLLSLLCNTGALIYFMNGRSNYAILNTLVTLSELCQLCSLMCSVNATK